jgi:hypothetical protein
MRFQVAFACFTVLFTQSVAGGASSQAAGEQQKVSVFSFSGRQYFHRYTTADQHEYTPVGQEDLKARTDMVTILFYRTTKDENALFATANKVLENYKANRAVVVKRDSFPRAPEKPNEHLIVVVFGRPGFIEAAFTRFRIHGGIGNAVVYSHRIYGARVGNEMSAWLEKNGPAVEAELMKWDSIPATLSPKQD